MGEVFMFWSQIIKAGEKVLLQSSPDYSIVVTNAVIPDVTNSTEKKPVRLFATVRTLNNTEEEEVDEKHALNDYTTEEVLICSLLPFKNETQILNFLFSPLNIVEFENKGSLDVHLSGVVLPNEEDEIENEEEEEDLEQNDNENEKPVPLTISTVDTKEEQAEGGELSADTIQNRFGKMAQAQGPRLIPQKKSKKDKKKKKQQQQ